MVEIDVVKNLKGVVETLSDYIKNYEDGTLTFDQLMDECKVSGYYITTIEELLEE